jgi:hypothetical protein
MIDWKRTKDIAPIYLIAGDTLTVTASEGYRRETVVYKIEKAITVNQLKVGVFENDFEMESGLVVVAGEVVAKRT